MRSISDFLFLLACCARIILLHGVLVTAAAPPPPPPPPHSLCGANRRYHWPCDVTSWDVAHDLQGDYHAVSNVAINNAVDVFGRNRRTVIVAKSPTFGDVAIVVVGACKVGSIDITSPRRQPAKKGDELGLFKYGGSTVVVVFDGKKVKFDEDLAANSCNRVETLVQVGSRLGTAQ